MKRDWRIQKTEKQQKQDPPMVWKRKLTAGILCLAVGFLLYILASRVPGMAEKYVSVVYSKITVLIGGSFGVVPFSCAEMLLYVLLIGLIGSFLRMLWKYIQGTKSTYVWKEWGASVFLTAAILFLLYVLNCGINYHREPFTTHAGMEGYFLTDKVRPSGKGMDSEISYHYTVDDLKRTCRILTMEVNRYATAVERDQKGRMYLSGYVQGKAAEAMAKLGAVYPVMAGYYPRPKPLLFSEILSVQSLTGIYAPFTVEANYNRDMTAYNIPFTMCHELSHLRGFMQEEEANFIAYLACLNSGEVQFQYSGSLLAWIHASNMLKRYDEKAWEELRGQLHEDVLADLRANSIYWDAYKSEIAEIAEQVNDTYLRANGQVDGVDSYNRMVDLLVEYWMIK